jgi:cation diffusion facilitator CzcD-associated flavoprotein CzcO
MAQHSEDAFSWNRKGSKPIHAIIVGAGIAGLLTAIGMQARQLDW